ncbi:helical backbone metal receptor [Nonlabens ponticola]|uniref:Iron ABC transporter substrate-binding protein n=1 Tax=Nonlabens ponticola TaxID=2496866 RepID=A0A3S9MXD6_9FLAO|nr:helical backbone metal receptor [Nonlabens ponticola]AZQ43936.1 iron ABC transporter substrate-binding protein [Nonlabens ponticola]
MISVKDQLNNLIELAQPAQRIVSLVPSQTELLFDLGLEDRIVGITRFCVHPARALETKTVVGGTKKVIQKRIKELQPDLIICNKEENTCEMVTRCQQIGPTYVSDIKTLQDSLYMIADIGKLTGTSDKATHLIKEISTAFDHLNSFKELRALYLIWKNPYMSIGHDTFIHDMMSHAGLDNVLIYQTRYPTLTIQQIVDLAPQVILFSSEPYNFKEVDMQDIVLAFAKADKSQPNCILVDGELFAWYGSRLLKSPGYFNDLRERLKV